MLCESLASFIVRVARQKRETREIRKEMKKRSTEGILDDLNRSRIKKDVSCLQNSAIDIGYEHREKTINA